MILNKNRYSFLMLCFIFWMMESSVILAQSDTPLMSKTKTSFKVVAFLPSWSISEDVIPFNSLTHLQYASIRPTSNGGVTMIENPQRLEEVVSKAHANDVKVGIAVGGWSNLKNEDFQEMASEPRYRQNFISNVLLLLEKYHLDGVDVNWQYPSTDVDQTNYTELLNELSRALHLKAKYLSATVAASGEEADKIQNQVFSVVDFFNLQAYDAAAGQDYSSYAIALSGINYWVNRGLPSSKIVLGIPFHAQPTWKSYKTLVSEGANANTDAHKGNFYNGLYTVKQKTQLALDRNMGGIMISDITQDATGKNSLMQAIHQSIPRQHDLQNSIPFTGTRHNIPGVIEAEQYDIGEEGIAYHDALPENAGGAFRTDAVDIEINASDVNDYKVAGIQAGEWLVYSVNVTTSGSLNLDVQVASAVGNKSFHIEMNGVDISGKIVVPNTGGWGEWQTVAVATTNLSPGKKKMRVVMDDGDFNLNRITFSRLSTTEAIAEDDQEVNVEIEAVDGVTVHPNPGVSGRPQYVTVTFNSSDHSDVNVLLSDINGYVLQNETHSVDAENKVILSLPNLPNGVYVLKIKSDGRSWSKRYFVK